MPLTGPLFAAAERKGPLPGATPASGMDPSDDELIAAVLQGDAASFEPLVTRYSPRLFATARRYARRESEVEDVVQEVWSKAFQKLATFRGDAPFDCLLYT